MIEIKFKKINPQAKLPTRATSGASCYDLYACLLTSSELTLNPGQRTLVSTGLAIQLPPGYEGQIRSRSGLALKHGVIVLNSPGTLDGDYAGIVGIILYNSGHLPVIVQDGDRIAQLYVGKVPTLQEETVWTEVQELDSTDRGVGGFGSTGK